MELLLSNYPPVKTNHSSFSSTFSELINKCDSLNIAVGYVSEKSLDFLSDFIHKKGRPFCNLIIGMHYFEKFSYSQYASALETEKFLKENDLGSVKLVTSFPFHGKIYSFNNNSGESSSIIGSSNLTNITPHKSGRQYELDTLINDQKFNVDISNFFNLLDRSSKSLSDPTLIIDGFKQTENFFSDLPGVVKISKDELYKVERHLDKSQTIQIPLKGYEDSPKSNLNVFFGKGRENTSTSIVRNRPWYEVELIVPKKITENPTYPKAGYPAKESIINVVTDDGYKFKCKISGTNSKNFRSEGDLKILGKWIKGRLENMGILKVGEPVYNKTLETYGRTNMSFTPLDKTLENWFLDFGV